MITLRKPAAFVPVVSTWERFDFGAVAASVAVAPDDVIQPDPDPTPHCGTVQPVPLDPPDPYRMFGTLGEPDRFEFTAGYDQGYIIVGFEPGRDLVVVDGASAGVDDFILQDIRAVTEDAIDGFHYQQRTGTLTVSNVLSVQFVTTEGETVGPALAVADFIII